MTSHIAKPFSQGARLDAVAHGVTEREALTGPHPDEYEEASLPRMRSLSPRDTCLASAGAGTPSGTSSLTEAIAAVKRDFVVEVADTPELIRAAQRLRYQVYCIERGFLESDDGLERDQFDIHSRHVVLRRRLDGDVVGTARLVLHDPGAPDDSYPMQRICDPSLLRPILRAATAEVSRFAISKLLRGASSSLTRLALIQGLFQASHELGLTDWCATMETTLLRLLRSSAIHFRPLGPLVEYHGPRQPCCANIAEIVDYMRVKRPEIWAFVTGNGHYYGATPAVIGPGQPRDIARDWQTTLSGKTAFAFFPGFEPAGMAALDSGAPPQYYRPLLQGHRT